jgi:AsmA protein
MQLALHGGSRAQLFPLSGMVFPETRPYAIAGHVVHAGQRWRYEKFSGRIGNSDIAGNLQVERGSRRPLLSADLLSQRLDIADLGPLVGARRGAPVVPTGAAVVPAGAGRGHLLPDIPFNAERWNSIDADVMLRAGTILRARELPLENLQVHLKMQDALLTLDPLDFAMAGGHLQAVIVLDGRQEPIRAQARISARKIQLARLFPTVDLAQRSVGQLNGEFELSGQGSSVGRMLAGADGHVGLVVSQGEISKLLMEKIGLHLLEIIQLKLLGDKTVKLNCFIADFGVKRGLMTSNALVLDTEVSTIVGTGTIDLRQESLDLTLVPATRATSPVAFRSPIHVRGPFAQPEVSLDKARLLARGAGALALGLINPALIILPLIEMGPGVESPCARMIPAVRASLGKVQERPAGGSTR